MVQVKAVEAVKVKICGITRAEDAILALQLGAWALGFIFYEKSPRYIAPEKVKLLLADLQRRGLKPSHAVGVFVDADEKAIRETIRLSGIDTVQLHGDEPAELLEQLKDVRIFKAFRLRDKADIAMIAKYEGAADAFLFDAAVAGAYGGTGQQSDWDLLAQIHSRTPLIVSGGLKPDNALAAVQRLNPFALDLSSGVESAPGIKDPEKLQQLFKKLGEAHGDRT